MGWLIAWRAVQGVVAGKAESATQASGVAYAVEAVVDTAKPAS